MLLCSVVKMDWNQESLGMFRYGRQLNSVQFQIFLFQKWKNSCPQLSLGRNIFLFSVLLFWFFYWRRHLQFPAWIYYFGACAKTSEVMLLLRKGQDFHPSLISYQSKFTIILQIYHCSLLLDILWGMTGDICKVFALFH